MGFLESLLDLVLPQTCAGCGQGRGLLCTECRDLLRSPARPSWPSPPPAGLPPPWAVAPYAGPVRAMIVAHKERGRTGLAEPLGRALAESVTAALESAEPDVADLLGALQSAESAEADPSLGTLGSVGSAEADPFGALGSVGSVEVDRFAALRRAKPADTDLLGAFGGAEPVGAGRFGVLGGAERAADGISGRPVLLVPVPSARAAVRARGHDPTFRLARTAAGALRRGGAAVVSARVLTQVRSVADQAGLSAAARIDNLAGALAASRAVCGRRAVLVDDVITTGASLAEAARAVQAAGGTVLAAATVAATHRRLPEGEVPL